MFETGMDGRIQPTHIPRTALGRKRFACVGANVYNLVLDAQLKNLPRVDEDVIDGVIGGDYGRVREAALAWGFAVEMDTVGAAAGSIRT
jgi:hypothetical protein